MGEYFPLSPENKNAEEYNKNLPGLGGVFNSRNLQTYHYAGNNPLKYSDPTGKFSIPLPNGASLDVSGEFSFNSKESNGLEFEVTFTENGFIITLANDLVSISIEADKESGTITVDVSIGATDEEGFGGGVSGYVVIDISTGKPIEWGGSLNLAEMIDIRLDGMTIDVKGLFKFNIDAGGDNIFSISLDVYIPIKGQKNAKAIVGASFSMKEDGSIGGSVKGGVSLKSPVKFLPSITVSGSVIINYRPPKTEDNGEE